MPRPLRVLGNPGALAPAVLCHDEQVCVVGRDIDLDHLVTAAELHAGDAGGGPAHRTDVALVKVDRLAETRDHQDVVISVGEPDADQLVALAHLQGDDPVGLERGVVLEELGLLDDAVLGREDEVLRLLVVARRDHGADELVLAERQQVHDRAALGLARAERQLVHLEPVDLADAREEQDEVVRGGDEEVLDVVVVLHVHPHYADPATPLLAGTVAADDPDDLIFWMVQEPAPTRQATPTRRDGRRAASCAGPGLFWFSVALKDRQTWSSRTNASPAAATEPSAAAGLDHVMGPPLCSGLSALSTALESSIP